MVQYLIARAGRALWVCARRALIPSGPVAEVDGARGELHLPARERSLGGCVAEGAVGMAAVRSAARRDRRRPSPSSVVHNMWARPSHRWPGVARRVARAAKGPQWRWPKGRTQSGEEKQ